ncbi:MAG: Asp-tRNA(Asn)/Glu-tRNA(Gln) amidotransferase subunit GatB [Pseudomonadota bacterium]|nr:Asp-tRNA(Asn)/Glu-tRNA(Gln) amidotransferase subunit GatB [Pseudomonadota bacterium]MDE3037044.1 Asp-tRNA(Asn)/Glu-tRNA(Gln) amidotransferase subunit GatB [Pseudomonadota bacterium]
MIKGNTGDWEIIIGLEVHAQVTTESKLFSGASTQFGNEPNANVSFVDAGMPGMLPVINAKAIGQAVKTGLAIGAKINLKSVFDRKNYFYPDLPQGYQISQFLDPIVGRGEVLLDMPEGVKKVGVTRIHIEQDAGKSLHEYNPKFTYIDLNRAGVALMEIVSEPDMRSADEAASYLKKLRSIVRYIGACDGDMEKGNMRCDANVSVRKPGAPLGTRCEIKNVNSVRFLHKAIEFEAMRQVEILESGGKIDQETRLFDASQGETRAMRSKEDAHDYRYFPDPDLLPLELTQEFVDNIKKSLPELPDQKKQRYMETFGFNSYNAGVLVAEQESAQFFEDTLKALDDKKTIGLTRLAGEVSNWLANELFGRLSKLGVEITQSPVSPEKFAGLIRLMVDNTISGKIAKDVLDFMMETGKEAAVIVEEKGLRQVTDTGAIEKVIDGVMAANPDKVAEYRAGKEKLFGFFVGQAMKASGGKANPSAVNELLKKMLSA